MSQANHDARGAADALRSIEGGHVLVAEDDDEMRHLLAETLRADGHEVDELADGRELLARVERQCRAREAGEPAERVDLIVSDVRMPHVTGLAALRRLRECHCATPLILMTAFGADDTRREAEALDALLFDKPFRMTDLRSAVRALLARARAR